MSCALALLTYPTCPSPPGTVIYLNASTPGEPANGTFLFKGFSGHCSVLRLISGGSFL